MGVGIVGYGRFGRFLHRAWGAEVVALCDRGGIATPELRARTYDDCAALFGDPSVTIVSVATEPATHAALALAALEANRHVIVEKPLALTKRDIQAVTSAAAAARVLVTVDHVLRHNPLVKAVTAIADEGLLGRLRTFTVTNHAIVDAVPSGHWFWDESRSGGILVEHGVHFFDLATRLIGSAPERVTGFRQLQPDGRVDGMAATIQHENGAIAYHAHVFCRTTEAERASIDLGFEQGSVTLIGWIPLQGELWADPALETLDRVEALLPGYRPLREASFPGLRGRFEIGQSKLEVYTGSLRALLQNFKAAIDGSEPLVVTLSDAARAVETALQATESARTWR